ncbi:pseudouridine synthase [Oscillospiraceae bacterium PP1C4]
MAQGKGIRIQKVLSDNGIMSRRKAEEAVQKGRITVNGHPALIGNPINPARDVIAIDGVRVVLQRKKENVYIMLHKPRGFVTTTSDEMGRRCVTDLVQEAPAKVYPVGRLDRNSEGLLLMTNDGAFANTIMHPSNHISKTYRVTARPNITDEQAAKMSAGIMIDGKMTLPATVLVLEKGEGRVVLQITIQEGRNRQVRRMCEAVGLEVARLKRTSIGPLKLGMLAPGEWRELKPSELIALRNAVSKK